MSNVLTAVAWLGQHLLLPRSNRGHGVTHSPDPAVFLKTKVKTGR